MPPALVTVIVLLEMAVLLETVAEERLPAWSAKALEPGFTFSPLAVDGASPSPRTNEAEETLELPGPRGKAASRRPELVP